jgi:hypothetical protein
MSHWYLASSMVLSSQSSYLHFQSSGIPGVHHHTWPPFLKLVPWLLSWKRICTTQDLLFSGPLTNKQINRFNSRNLSKLGLKQRI